MTLTMFSEELLFSIIRGQLPLSALRDAGIAFDINETKLSGDRQIRLKLTAPFTVAPKPTDLAMGLLAYQKQPKQLRDWAVFMLGASELIDLGPLDDWAEGDELLNGLWDASFEGKLRPETVSVAAVLVDG